MGRLDAFQPPTAAEQAAAGIYDAPCARCGDECSALSLDRDGRCPDCHGTHACRYCGVVDALDASGHCEHCCDGVFVPADARADLDALADAAFAVMVAESDSPALDALPWESPWLPAAAEACAAA